MFFSSSISRVEAFGDVSYDKTEVFYFASSSDISGLKIGIKRPLMLNRKLKVDVRDEKSSFIARIGGTITPQDGMSNSFFMDDMNRILCHTKSIYVVISVNLETIEDVGVNEFEVFVTRVEPNGETPQ